MSCGVGCRPSSDPMLLRLWRRPAATAPIQPLAWEPPCAAHAALKRPKKKRLFMISGSRLTHQSPLLWSPKSLSAVQNCQRLLRIQCAFYFCGSAPALPPLVMLQTFTLPLNTSFSLRPFAEFPYQIKACTALDHTSISKASPPICFPYNIYMLYNCTISSMSTECFHLCIWGVFTSVFPVPTMAPGTTK